MFAIKLTIHYNPSMKIPYEYCEFLVEFLRYTDDEDIKTLLRFCITKKEWSKNTEGEYSYQAILLAYLMYKNNPYNRFLTLHLTAICNCYNSYKCRFFDNKKEFKAIQDKFCEYFQQTPSKVKSITEKDKSKIFKLIINSYKKNEFYYCFDDNRLVKVEIADLELMNKMGCEIAETSYLLKNKNGIKYIVNEKSNVHYKLKNKLPLDKIVCDYSNLESKEQFVLAFKECLESIDFQEIKEIHNSIISAISDFKNNECTWCFPELDNNRSKKLCDNCKNLNDTISEFKKTVLDYVENKTKGKYILTDNIYKICYEINLDKYIKDEKYNSTLGMDELRQRRKIKLDTIFKKAAEEINVKVKEIKPTEFEQYLIDEIKVIRNLINRSFR